MLSGSTRHVHPTRVCNPSAHSLFSTRDKGCVTFGFRVPQVPRRSRNTAFELALSQLSAEDINLASSLLCAIDSPDNAEEAKTEQADIPSQGAALGTRQRSRLADSWTAYRPSQTLSWSFTSRDIPNALFGHTDLTS